MKKMYVMWILSVSLLIGENVNIIDSCKSINILKVDIDKKIPYGNTKVISFQYGLKNKTDKKIDKITITVYLKDNQGIRIFDKSFSERDIKPHYEIPFDDSMYYSIDPIPSSYANNVDVEFKCEGSSNIKSTNTPLTQDQDEKMKIFMSRVLKSTEEIWSKVLAKHGMRYVRPVMVLYRGYTRSGCATAQTQTGPFYCPIDKKIYFDLGFFSELAGRYNSPGDFAQAYVLAHEIGHHIQDLEGTLDKVHQKKQSWGEHDLRSTALQVRVELQADCYAGVWGHYAQKKFHILEPGDIEEALRAASSIGDDTLQKEVDQRVRPDAFTHGSFAQRVSWFKRGFTSGDLKQCDTFTNE